MIRFKLMARKTRTLCKTYNRSNYGLKRLTLKTPNESTHRKRFVFVDLPKKICLCRLTIETHEELFWKPGEAFWKWITSVRIFSSVNWKKSKNCVVWFNMKFELEFLYYKSLRLSWKKKYSHMNSVWELVFCSIILLFFCIKSDNEMISYLNFSFGGYIIIIFFFRKNWTTCWIDQSVTRLYAVTTIAPKTRKTRSFSENVLLRRMWI